jgi:hypothetical protein
VSCIKVSFGKYKQIDQLDLMARAIRDVNATSA